jgi:hypothetical protein
MMEAVLWQAGMRIDVHSTEVVSTGFGSSHIVYVMRITTPVFEPAPAAASLPEEREAEETRSAEDKRETDSGRRWVTNQEKQDEERQAVMDQEGEAGKLVLRQEEGQVDEAGGGLNTVIRMELGAKVEARADDLAEATKAAVVAELEAREGAMMEEMVVQEAVVAHDAPHLELITVKKRYSQLDAFHTFIKGAFANAGMTSGLIFPPKSLTMSMTTIGKWPSDQKVFDQTRSPTLAIYCLILLTPSLSISPLLPPLALLRHGHR